MWIQNTTVFVCPYCGNNNWGSTENENKIRQYYCNSCHQTNFSEEDSWKYFIGRKELHFQSLEEFKNWDQKILSGHTS